LRFKTGGATGNEQLLFVTVVTLTCDDMQLFFTIASATLTPIVASVMTIENNKASLRDSPYDKGEETLGTLTLLNSIINEMTWEVTGFQRIRLTRSFLALVFVVINI